MIRSVAFACVLGVAMLSGAGVSQATDPDRGRILARKCSVCHGKLGIGKDPEIPHIAGQPELYLEKSLFDYQTGKRRDRRMTLMAKPLSKQDVKDLAAWFASLKITVQTPKK